MKTARAVHPADPTTGAVDVSHLKGGRMTIARSRGAASGFLLILLGIWGALIPFVGPYFDFAYSPDQPWVWTDAPEATGEMPRLTPSSLVWTCSSTPRRFAVSSRNAIISRNFQVVSTCSSGNGSFEGAKAFSARCSITLESLPME